MGGTVSLITTTLGSMLGLGSKKSDSAKQLERERQAREEEQNKREADDRRRAREKVMEARDLEGRRKRSTLSTGAASLLEEPDVAAPSLKNKLGE